MRRSAPGIASTSAGVDVDAATPNARAAPRRRSSAVVVSSSAIADRVGVDRAQVDAALSAAASDRVGARPGTRTVSVSKNVVVHDVDAAAAQRRRRGRA